MSGLVVIFSIDEIRGGITQKVLKRSGFETLLLRTILRAKDAIAKHAPKVVIFDIGSYFSEEVNEIRSLCGALEHTPVIVLGNRSITGRFEGTGIRVELVLSDPLDPELIVEKVKEVFSLKVKGKPSEGDTLEEDLKHFLKLD